MTDEPIRIAHLARWMLAHLEDLRHLDAAPEAVEEIHAIVEQFRRDIDRPAQRWYAGPCEDCGEDIYTEATSRHALIECGCGRKYELDSRRRFLLDQASDMLFTATEISRALTAFGSRGVTVDMVYGYARRKRILPHGEDHRGHALYRLGDVRQLVETDATRRALSPA